MTNLVLHILKVQDCFTFGFNVLLKSDMPVTIGSYLGSKSVFEQVSSLYIICPCKRKSWGYLFCRNDHVSRAYLFKGTMMVHTKIGILNFANGGLKCSSFFNPKLIFHFS